MLYKPDNSRNIQVIFSFLEAQHRSLNYGTRPGTTFHSDTKLCHVVLRYHSDTLFLLMCRRMDEESMPFTRPNMNILLKDCSTQPYISSGFRKFVVNLIEYGIPRAVSTNTDVLPRHTKDSLHNWNFLLLIPVAIHIHRLYPNTILNYSRLI
jgi:hypothetical protein